MTTDRPTERPTERSTDQSSPYDGRVDGEWQACRLFTRQTNGQTDKKRIETEAPEGPTPARGRQVGLNEVASE